jgi:hypothetical protein
VATEALAWAGSPTTTDAVDGSQAYNLGTLFTVDTDDTPCPGVEWRVPDSVANPQGGPHAISVWEDVSGTRIAYEEISPAAFVGTEHTFTFTTPPTLDSGISYVAAVYTNHYVYSSGAPTGTTSPSGRITATGSRLAAYNSGAATAPKPTDTSSLTFYVSPVVDLGGAAATGEIAVTLPALQATAAGSVTATGVAAATLPALQATAAGIVTATGAASITLPALQAALSGESPGAGVISATLPALRASLQGTVTLPPVTGLQGRYRALLDELRQAIRDLGAPLRVVDDPAARVGSRDVVIGPPTFLFEGMCSPDSPTGATYDVFLIEALGERAVDRLLANLPALLAAVGSLSEDTTVSGCAPGAFPSGTSDLPCYRISAETTF